MTAKKTGQLQQRGGQAAKKKINNKRDPGAMNTMKNKKKAVPWINPNENKSEALIFEDFR